MLSSHFRMRWLGGGVLSILGAGLGVYGLNATGVGYEAVLSHELSSFDEEENRLVQDFLDINNSKLKATDLLKEYFKGLPGARVMSTVLSGYLLDRFLGTTKDITLKSQHQALKNKYKGRLDSLEYQEELKGIFLAKLREHLGSKLSIELQDNDNSYVKTFIHYAVDDFMEKERPLRLNRVDFEYDSHIPQDRIRELGISGKGNTRAGYEAPHFTDEARKRFKEFIKDPHSHAKPYDITITSLHESHETSQFLIAALHLFNQDVNKDVNKDVIKLIELTDKEKEIEDYFTNKHGANQQPQPQPQPQAAASASPIDEFFKVKLPGKSTQNQNQQNNDNPWIFWKDRKGAHAMRVDDDLIETLKYYRSYQDRVDKIRFMNKLKLDNEYLSRVMPGYLEKNLDRLIIGYSPMVNSDGTIWTMANEASDFLALGEILLNRRTLKAKLLRDYMGIDPDVGYVGNFPSSDDDKKKQKEQKIAPLLDLYKTNSIEATVTRSSGFSIGGLIRSIFSWPMLWPPGQTEYYHQNKFRKLDGSKYRESLKNFWPKIDSYFQEKGTGEGRDRIFELDVKEDKRSNYPYIANLLRKSMGKDQILGLLMVEALKNHKCFQNDEKKEKLKSKDDCDMTDLNYDSIWSGKTSKDSSKVLINAYLRERFRDELIMPLALSDSLDAVQDELNTLPGLNGELHSPETRGLLEDLTIFEELAKSDFGAIREGLQRRMRSLGNPLSGFLFAQKFSRGDDCDPAEDKMEKVKEKFKYESDLKKSFERRNMKLFGDNSQWDRSKCFYLRHAIDYATLKVNGSDEKYAGYAGLMVGEGDFKGVLPEEVYGKFMLGKNIWASQEEFKKELDEARTHEAMDAMVDKLRGIFPGKDFSEWYRSSTGIAGGTPSLRNIPRVVSHDMDIGSRRELIKGKLNGIKFEKFRDFVKHNGSYMLRDNQGNNWSLYFLQVGRDDAENGENWKKLLKENLSLDLMMRTVVKEGARAEVRREILNRKLGSIKTGDARVMAVLDGEIPSP